MVHVDFVNLGKNLGFSFFGTGLVLMKILDSLKIAHLGGYREHIDFFPNCKRGATSPLAGSTDKNCSKNSQEI